MGWLGGECSGMIHRVLALAAVCISGWVRAAEADLIFYGGTGRALSSMARK